MNIADARILFQPASGLAYFDTASYGLPPRPTVEAMQMALLRWQGGTASWTADWDLEGDAARSLFARLIGAAADEIALIPTASVGVAPIASTLMAGDEVVVPADEFTSVLFPLLMAQEQRGTVVRQVPFDDVANAINERTTLVATSLIRSQDGRMANLAAISAVAERFGTAVLVDATHAIPFVPIADELSRIAYLVCHGYKHLLCPRGAAFLYVRRDRWDTIPAIQANWRAADAPYARSYGGPLTLARSAARFDVSLDWFAWVGARASLELLVQWQHDDLLAIPLQQAADLAQRLGLPEPAASIVAAPVPDPAAVLGRLRDASIKAAAPAGSVRLATHLYTTEDDIARVATILAPLVERR